MKKRVLQLLFSAVLLAAAALTALTLPASAQLQTYTVVLPSGEVVTVDVPSGTPPSDLPGQIVPPGTPGVPAPEPVAPAPAPAPAPAAPAPAVPAPKPGGGGEQPRGGDRKPADRQGDPSRPSDVQVVEGEPQAQAELDRPQRRGGLDRPMRNSDGSPAVSNPGFVDALPGPSLASGVPNFVIRKFRVPVFLLPIYQAAGIEYGVRWEILAAINEIETDYGRNLNVSSAGALGWMQFIPSSWKAYGVDANKDGVKDPYNPVDAIFAAGRYLKAAGYEQDVRKSIFAYNHANWYVDSVMLRARLIAGVPSDLVGSLTGLTEGRFPVAARARYADDLQEKEQLKRVKAGENAANIVETNDQRNTVSIFANKGAPVVATNDGIIKKIGNNKKLGKHIILQDVYGNRYTYTGLGKTAQYHPVPKESAATEGRSALALKANDPQPAAPASAGAQPAKKPKARRRPLAKPRASAPVKRRLFAHPAMKSSREAGGLEQLLDMRALREGGYTTYANHFARPVRLDTGRFRLRRLRVGSQVIGGTVLGRVGRPVEGEAAHVDFGIRPAGQGAPDVDPKPILDGWKLLEATAIYRATGRNALYGKDAESMSIGQIMLLPKRMLEKRVLADERIEIYDCGRTDVQSGLIDRRVLATLAYLAESGLRPSVTSLRCGHGFFTASGNVSHHSSGNAVDIAAINGVPIIGHQEAGGVTEQAVRRMMSLQGTMRADQIISLLNLGDNTVAMGDHADHIHVGFAPRFGANGKAGRQAQAVLRPGQWPQLLDRLEEIENPVVPTKPSPYALPVEKKDRGD